MIWNSDEQAYFGETSDGRTVRVEGDEMAEAAQDAGLENVADYESVSELNDPDMWAGLAGDNQNVEIVEK